MAFSLWSTPFTESVSTVSAAFLNKVRLDLSRAIDGINGGTYTLMSLLTLMGSGLKLGETAGVAANVQLASRSVTRHGSLAGAATISANWALTNTPALAWENSAAGGTLWLPLDGAVPHGSVITSVTLRWKGAAGHAAFPGGAPAMPTVQAFKIDSSGTETALATATSDTSASAGAYEAAHSIVHTISSAHTIDRATYRYVAKVIGETGGNFVAGAKALGVSATCTCTSYSEQP